MKKAIIVGATSFIAKALASRIIVNLKPIHSNENIY
tara:strand:+ start:2775 stop:2882 length:108 start_codon:yes stop_codon:yes gene_type:complete